MSEFRRRFQDHGPCVPFILWASAAKLLSRRRAGEAWGPYVCLWPEADIQLIWPVRSVCSPSTIAQTR